MLTLFLNFKVLTFLTKEINRHELEKPQIINQDYEVQQAVSKSGWWVWVKV